MSFLACCTCFREYEVSLVPPSGREGGGREGGREGEQVGKEG